MTLMLNDTPEPADTLPALYPKTGITAPTPNPRGAAEDAEKKERDRIVAWLVAESDRMMPGVPRDVTTFLAFLIHSNLHNQKPTARPT